MSGASFDTLCKRSHYAGSRKARRAEQRIDALLKPFGRLVLQGFAATMTANMRRVIVAGRHKRSDGGSDG